MLMLQGLCVLFFHCALDSSVRAAWSVALCRRSQRRTSSSSNGVVRRKDTSGRLSSFGGTDSTGVSTSAASGHPRRSGAPGGTEGWALATGRSEQSAHSGDSGVDATGNSGGSGASYNSLRGDAIQNEVYLPAQVGGHDSLTSASDVCAATSVEGKHAPAVDYTAIHASTTQSTSKLPSAI